MLRLENQHKNTSKHDLHTGRVLDEYLKYFIYIFSFYKFQKGKFQRSVLKINTKILVSIAYIYVEVWSAFDEECIN